MEIKKIIISPNNKKAIAFFDDLNRRKADLFKKIDEMAAARYSTLKNK